MLINSVLHENGMTTYFQCIQKKYNQANLSHLGLSVFGYFFVAMVQLPAILYYVPHMSYVKKTNGLDTG